MNKSFVKIMLFIPSMILTFEAIAYIFLFSIIPAIMNKLGVFEYSMAITNYDLNKIWIGFICFSLFIVYLRINSSSKAVYEMIYICSYLFIGLNLVISTVIFSYFRLYGSPITDILSMQKYFGATIFILYGLVFSLIPMMLLLPKSEKIILDDTTVKID